MKKRNNYLLLFFIIFSILVLFTFLYVRVTKEKFTNPDTYDIIILAGQSNSLGRGTRNHNPSQSSNTLSHGKISPTDDLNANIKQLSLNGTSITSCIEPIVANTDRGKKDPTIGHGLSFAKNYLLNNPTKKILVVGCGYSVGGSSVLINNGKRWRWDTTSNSLFYSIYTILQNAISNNKININSSVKAILWDQGESDITAILNDSRDSYKTILKNSFESVRSNINKILHNTNATFPILISGMCLGQNYYNNQRITGNVNGKPKVGSYTYRIDMNTYLSNVLVPYLNSNISNVRYVPTDIINGTEFTNVLQCDSTIDSNGKIIEKNNDINHFSATSQRELGKRFYYYFTR